MNDVVVFQEERLTAVAIRANVNLVQEVMQGVMKKDVHYGTIPGTPKPTLYKPGAEVLAATFRIAVSYQIEDLSGHDFARYRVTAIGTHQTSGIVMGAGMGECSSMEEKYKWRKASSTAEFAHTTEDRRRIKYGYNRNDRREYEIQQVRTDHPDLSNTILKMACKRAQVAMTLNVTAASDIFNQDIEDLPEELRHDDETTTAQPIQQPRSKSSAPSPERPPLPEGATAGGAGLGDDSPLSEGEKNFLRRKMEEGALGDADLLTKFQKKIDDLRKSDFGAVKAWLANPAG